MEDPKENNPVWMSVPAFGDWDMKQGVPDYSMDFSKIREARKINKTRISIGNEDELLPPRDYVEIPGQPGDNNQQQQQQPQQPRQQQQQPQQRRQQHRSRSTWKKITSCFAGGMER